jgi:putative flippase GtrA
VAKVAQMRVRIFEMGVSYSGRTYEEGKKIGVRDGFRALYCILRYNAFSAPVVLQFFACAVPGTIALFANLFLFLILRKMGLADAFSMPGAFLLSAGVNHLLCTTFIFRRGARWTPIGEIALALMLAAVGTVVDYQAAQHLLVLQMPPLQAKAASCVAGLVLLFCGMRYLVFPEAPTGSWNSQLRR